MQGHILLIGFMGVGKSTVSRKLAKMLHVREIDTDAVIEEREGMKISEIFAQKGEAYFRSCETQLLRELGNEKMSPMIISCGGGMALQSENAKLMQTVGTVVWLTAKAETILKRVEGNNNRPILRGNMNTTFIGELLEQRREKYEAAAMVQVATDGRKVYDICMEIIEKAV